MYLTKSDFKVARTCPTKLYYRKMRYPSLSDDDPYVEFLADGGYMVEAIAKLLFPEGLEVQGTSTEEMFAATSQALRQDEVTLFQATLIHGQLRAQVDILEKRGNRFRLIEVKAKTVELGDDLASPFSWKKGIYSKWKPYIEDVAYQTHILRGLYPDAQVIPCLCVIDKTQTATSDTAFENFQIKRRPKGIFGDFRKPEITFSGDVEALREQSFVRIFDVTGEVEAVFPDVKNEAAIFAASLSGDHPYRIDPKLSSVCKKCEFRIEPREQNGFRECWGELADPTPHLLDLYQVGRLKAEVFDDMIERRMTRLLDISVESLSGKTGERQKIQIESTLRNEEFINPKLAEILANCKYPLQFVDFEATRMAVPYHAGMNPYGLVAFQWSCQTIAAPGADLVDRSWINVNDAYPNFEFAETLKNVVTPAGTAFVWSSFECTVLKDIRKRRRKLTV